jgi:hypothetical protein
VFDDLEDLDLLEQLGGWKEEEVDPAGCARQVDDLLPLGRLLVGFGLLGRDADDPLKV